MLFSSDNPITKNNKPRNKYIKEYISVLSVIVPKRASIAARKPKITLNFSNNLIPSYTKRNLSSIDKKCP